MQQARERIENMPRCPMPLGYLWQSYLQMRQHCASSGMGIAPFSWHDLSGWQRFSGNQIEPFELAIFEGLDRIMLKANAPSAPS